MIAWGGNGSTELNTGGIYDPAADSWLPTYAPPVSARWGHAAIWTGDRMLVWGGSVTNLTMFNTGGMYDPVLDSWTGTSTVAAPQARTYPAAVWTGNRMIVWGGQATSDYLASGGVFDPDTNSWVPTTTTNAPSGRGGHTAVWTGAQMLVWGGVNSSTFGLADGSVYDPAADTWTPLPGAGSPSRRQGHTAVWDGTRMLVWGGSYRSLINSPLEYLGSGAAYDPGTGLWSALATTGAPAPRDRHTTIWTGDRMLVWGGSNGPPLNTGGSYNPVTNTWTATPTAGAPSHRADHTAVWSEDRMLVWGGGIFDTGGFYDPVLAEWTAMPVEGAPLGRASHSAVFDGTAMLVFGGWRSSALNSGGRLRLVYSIADRDGDGYLCSEECDDAHAQVFPGNPESCDGLDNDCDGTADGFATACGIGACAAAGVCTGGSDSCVPGSPTAEICDGLDNDCDGALPAAEGDGDGDESPSCADCDDADADTFPGAPEVNDGIDNQCSGDGGFGLVDEISGLSGFTVAGDPTQFCWPAQGGASTYEVIRSAQADFATGCLHTETSATCWSDTANPAAGSAAYYLVRALTPSPGSWGADGTGAERVGLCGE